MIVTKCAYAAFLFRPISLFLVVFVFSFFCVSFLGRDYNFQLILPRATDLHKTRNPISCDHIRFTMSNARYWSVGFHSSGFDKMGFIVIQTDVPLRITEDTSSGTDSLSPMPVQSRHVPPTSNRERLAVSSTVATFDTGGKVNKGLCTARLAVPEA